MISKLDDTEEKSKDSCLNLNFPAFDDVFRLDLGHVSRHQTPDQEHAKLINTKRKI